MDGGLCSPASEDDATAQPWQSNDGAGGVRAGSGTVRARCWGRRRRTEGGRGVREAVEARGWSGDREEAAVISPAAHRREERDRERGRDATGGRKEIERKLGLEGEVGPA